MFRRQLSRWLWLQWAIHVAKEWEKQDHVYGFLNTRWKDCEFFFWQRWSHVGFWSWLLLMWLLIRLHTKNMSKDSGPVKHKKTWQRHLPNNLQSRDPAPEHSRALTWLPPTYQTHPLTFSSLISDPSNTRMLSGWCNSEFHVLVD